MAKKTGRTRSVQAPKAKSSVPLERIERASRTVALKLSPASVKHAGKRNDREAAGSR